MNECCQRCGEAGQDRRILWMACLYEMGELGLPFEKSDRFFTLRVCKDCRADWMSAIKTWFNTKPDRAEYSGGYYVRELGATRSKPAP
ncbi:MAG TPA: hypothetical protein VEF04_09525 [Blastocatellia bacterium]|nr:hypothetical protein [Blastocatellia bacterium]